MCVCVLLLIILTDLLRPIILCSNFNLCRQKKIHNVFMFYTISIILSEDGGPEVGGS